MLDQTGLENTWAALRRATAPGISVRRVFTLWFLLVPRLYKTFTSVFFQSFPQNAPEARRTG
jgi:hypothetical protein